jgi:hypothetical protein
MDSSNVLVTLTLEKIGVGEKSLSLLPEFGSSSIIVQYVPYTEKTNASKIRVQTKSIEGKIDKPPSLRPEKLDMIQRSCRCP